MHRLRLMYILLFVSVVQPASAQDRAELWERCSASSVGANGTSADLIIGACASLIQSGQENTQNLALVLTKRGWQYGYRKRDFDQGLKDLNEAIQLQPNYTQAWAERCALKGMKSDYDAALGDCDKAIELAPQEASAWAFRGDILSEKGEEDRAIRDYTKAIELATNWMWPLNDRANIYEKRHQWDLAIRDFIRVIAISPDNAVGYESRCWLLAISGGDLTQALADCNKALTLQSDSENALDSRGFVYLKMKSYSKAIEDYDAALTRDAKLATSLYGRGIAKLHNGQSDSGNADIAAAKAIDPKIADEFADWGVSGI
jgi:tetratricopeptide (TPR) repeat protein